MITRRTTILTAIAIGALLLAFSGFSWLCEVARAERHPLPHQITGSAVSWDPRYIWQGPTLLQQVSIVVSVLAGFLALWSLKRDGRKRPDPRMDPRFEWTQEDEEALRKYLEDEQHKRAS